MKFPKGILEFSVSSLEDIRFLWKAWDRQLGEEGRDVTWSPLVSV